MVPSAPIVLDCIERLDRAASVAEAWQGFQSFTRWHGLAFGAIPDLRKLRRREHDNVLAVTWPHEWGERYFWEDYVWRDPMVRSLAYTDEPFTWPEALAFEDYATPDRNIMFEAEDHGLRGGLMIPISSDIVVTLAGENTALSPRDRIELHFAAIYVHARIRALAPARKRRPIAVLTARERECLAWAAAGKSDWEIGEILSIAAKTAGAHIERAKQKLGVSTRIQAVVIALQTGAISI
ncbi:MAG TPA: LuxR C-terminal-related transcriptional regulator [Rhizomicrobium sp.]|jgi:LuxR family quorum sensing-dependent transcriptional regulator|nr:LuxR C-terminal-related transcriptional regulator [Rhizomicrobium sp.]